MDIIDFDKLYNQYVTKWTKENIEKLKDNDPLIFVEKIYEEWIISPIKEIGGLSVKEYFDNFNANQLIKLLKEYSNKNIAIPSPLIDKLSDIKYQNFIFDLLQEKDIKEEIFILATNILEEIESKLHYDFLIKTMLNKNNDKQIKDFIAEVLSQHTEKIKDKLINKIKDDNSENDIYIADVLVYCKNNEKIFNLLKNLFLSGINNTLYAGYLGMYEDDRALPYLQKRIESEELGFVEFSEIRNSIERLGGEPVKTRDFSSDPDYKILKNIK